LITAVEGKIEARLPEGIVVQVGGVSLLVQTPTSTHGRIGPDGSTVRLHTHLHVREDNLSLFGFFTTEELGMFEQLISISGVGPKLGLAILSYLSPDALRAAIAAGNVDTLTHVPGVGKRTAGRLVLELRGKIAPALADGPTLPAAGSEDVINALSALGYAPTQIQSALRSLPPDPSLTVEDKIILSLRYLAPQ
jgi:holliday junction DNA helicase RuvA